MSETLENCKVELTAFKEWGDQRSIRITTPNGEQYWIQLREKNYRVNTKFHEATINEELFMKMHYIQARDKMTSQGCE